VGEVERPDVPDIGTEDRAIGNLEILILMRVSRP
jgi:hypothetical protein